MPHKNHRTFHLDPADANKRLDHVLMLLNPDLSRSKLQHMIRDHAVTIDDQIISTPSYKVQSNQTLTLHLIEAQPSCLTPEDIPLDIIFEDHDLLVLNKNPGLVVHPGCGHHQGTLVHALLHHCGSRLSTIGDTQRPGIVHRLDKGTSGLMVIAKTDDAHKALSLQFASHSLTRQYLAFCWGYPCPAQGTIQTHLGRHPHHRQKMAVLDDVCGRGKNAITHYRVLHHKAPISMIECTLHTGRTHQVRVHMSHLRHSLIGDPLYGTSPSLRHLNSFKELIPAIHHLEHAQRPALHSSVLTFNHPVSRQEMLFESPLPKDLQPLQDYCSRIT